jgi:hypothetical protein
LAQLRLKTNPDDPNALFAMTLSLGMQANYASLIDKHQLDSLKKVREADVYAKKLLVVAPDAADAYLGLGMANYFIGSLPGTKKFFFGFAGIHGDKNAGIQQLEIAADHGHYLRPFAKILLALAALREKKTEVARAQLHDLVAEFPENPLFASELAKLKVSPAANTSPQWCILSERSAPTFPACHAFVSQTPRSVLVPDKRLSVKLVLVPRCPVPRLVPHFTADPKDSRATTP